MQGRVNNIIELERVVMEDDDDLFDRRRYPGWELKLNNDKLCFFTRSDPKPASCKRHGDRVWIEFKLFSRVFGFDVARPGAQKPPPRPAGMPAIDDVESAISFLYEALDQFKRVLTQIDLAHEEEHRA